MGFHSGVLSSGDSSATRGVFSVVRAALRSERHYPSGRCRARGRWHAEEENDAICDIFRDKCHMTHVGEIAIFAIVCSVMNDGVAVLKPLGWQSPACLGSYFGRGMSQTDRHDLILTAGC